MFRLVAESMNFEDPIPVETDDDDDDVECIFLGWFILSRQLWRVVVQGTQYKKVESL
jgi:hypothetical protein